MMQLKFLAGLQNDNDRIPFPILFPHDRSF